MGCLKRYESVQEILKEFFELRLHYYKLRKDWLVGSLGSESAKLSNQARFVLEKIEGKLSIGEISICLTDFKNLFGLNPLSEVYVFFLSFWVVSLHFCFSVTGNSSFAAEEK